MNHPILGSPLRTRLGSLRTSVFIITASGIACLAGWYGAAFSPVLIGGGLLAALLVASALRDLRLALIGTITIIALLPFGVVPLDLGGSPTLLEVLLLLTIIGWLARRVATGQGRVRLSVAGPFILLFQSTLVAAQIAALAQNESLAVIRMIFKLELAIAFFFVCASLGTSDDCRRLIIRSLILLGTCQALVALALFMAPRDLAQRMLIGLGSLGYPTNSTVLRYLPDTDRLRAIGTAIDPNILGAFLMMVGVIAITQLLSTKPVLQRSWLIIATAIVVPALLLSFSRSSWLGLVGGVGLAALARYWRLLPIMGAALLTLIFWAPTQRYALHLLSGLRAQDRAAFMRLGELENAWEIIQAYPWLGIGFGEAPEVTLYPGVSNVFLTFAEQAGLIGLGAYVSALAVTIGTAVIFWWRGRENPGADLLLSILAALTAALVASMLDHHFARVPHLLALFWGLAGLAVASAHDARSRNGHRQNHNAENKKGASLPSPT